MIIEKPLRLIPMSRRIPFFYIERVRISREGNQIFAYRDGKAINLPTASIASLLMGPGCSITTEALKECSANGCSVIASGEYGLPAHMTTVVYRSPARKMAQYKIATSERLRITFAKKMFSKKIQYFLMTSIPQNDEKYKRCTSVNELMGVEASLMKRAYSEFAKKYQFQWSRKSDLDISSPLKINYLNHLCYSVTAVILAHLGFDPDIGIMHGRTKGGGLIFDVADIFKPLMALEMAFKNIGASNADLRKIFFETLIERRVIDDVSKFLLEELK